MKASTHEVPALYEGGRNLAYNDVRGFSSEECWR